MKNLTYSPAIKMCIGLLVIILIFVNGKSAIAQFKQPSSTFYYNQYLANPAIAGRTKVFNAILGFNSQLAKFPGAPQAQFLAADYGFSSKSGVGVKLYNDKAGLLRKTSFAATYAYHLPVGDKKQLSFGLSAIFINDHLNEGLVSGDIDDADLLDVNQRKANFDSDFGIAYLSEKIDFQAVFPNMVNTISGDDNFANQTVLLSSLSYRLNMAAGSLEPKVIYRVIKGYKDLIDVGANFVFSSSTVNKVNVMAIYHSAKNASFGIGISIREKFSFNTSYTLATQEMMEYSGGDFELGVGIRL